MPKTETLELVKRKIKWHLKAALAQRGLGF